jgi:Putative DNA-binding domain
MNARATSFQRRFVELLLTPDDVAADSLPMQPGFAIYRNTVRKGLIDALQANYPAVNRLVGDQWFRAVAAQFVSQHPATDARLLHYGVEFARFLETFPPATALPYLAQVARLDRLWTLAHTATDDDAITVYALASFTPESFDTHTLQPRASTYWTWSATQPVFSLWTANRDGEAARSDLSDIAWQGEGIIIYRPDQAVTYQCADAASIAFLDACRAGKSIARAAACAVSIDANCDLQALIAKLIQSHTFTALTAVRS